MNQDLSDRDLDDQDLADRDLLDKDLAEASLQQDDPSPVKKSPNTVLAPSELARRLEERPILVDIDGTLLDLAPTPREVRVPAGLAATLNALLVRASAALALVSGPSLNDNVLVFSPEQ